MTTSIIEELKYSGGYFDIYWEDEGITGRREISIKET